MDSVKKSDFIGDWLGCISGYVREISYGQPGRIKHWKVETAQDMEFKIKVEDPLKTFIDMFGAVPAGIKTEFKQYRFEGEAVVSGSYRYEHFDVDCPLECKNSPSRAKDFPAVTVSARIKFDDTNAVIELSGFPTEYSHHGFGIRPVLKVARRDFEAIDFEYFHEEDDEICISFAFAGRLRRPERYLKIEYAPDCSGILSNPFTRAAVLDLGEKLDADKILVTGADRTREVHQTLVDKGDTSTKYENCCHGEHKGHKAADVMYFRDRGKTAVNPGEVEAMAETMDKIGGIGTYNTFNHIDIRNRLPNGRPAKWRGNKQKKGRGV